MQPFQNWPFVFVRIMIMVFVTSFMLSLVGTFLILSIPALRQSSSVTPTSDRWHQQATPGLAGIPMFIAFFGTTVFTGIDWQSLQLPVIAGASVLFIAGVIDDLHPLNARLKLLTQAIAAAVVLLTGTAYFETTDIVGINVLLGLVWMLAIANGINLLDNMDGLAGGICLIATASMLLLLGTSGQQHHSTTLMLLAVLGALAGFMVFNINPAKVFMGDSGSQWLGLVMGACSYHLLSIDTLSAVKLPTLFLVPILILLVPLVDTSFVIVTRKLRGQAITQGGRDHLSHRLVGCGFSQRTSVALLWLLSIAGSCVAFAVIHNSLLVWAPLFVLLIVALVILIKKVLGVSIATQQVS